MLFRSNHFLSEEVTETYAISADRHRGWVTVSGDDADAVRIVVE